MSRSEHIGPDLEGQCRELTATELHLRVADISDRFRIRIEGNHVVAALDGYTTRAPLELDVEASAYSITWSLIEALRDNYAR